MKTHFYFIDLFVSMAALETTAQITVDSNNQVGLGAGNTTPSFAVDILGTTAIRLA